MCNRVRDSYEPETLHLNFATLWGAERPMDNRFNPVEQMPRSRAYPTERMAVRGPVSPTRTVSASREAE